MCLRHWRRLWMFLHSSCSLRSGLQWAWCLHCMENSRDLSWVTVCFLFFEALNSCEPGVCNYRDLYINLLSKHTPSFFVFFTLLLLINKLDLFCIKLHSITNRDQSGHVLLQAYKAFETEFSHFYNSQTIN